MGGWEVKFKVLAGSVSGDPAHLFREDDCTFVSTGDKRELTSCLALALYFFFFFNKGINKGTNPIHEGFTLMTLPPKAPFLKTITLGWSLTTPGAQRHLMLSPQRSFNISSSLPGADTQHWDPTPVGVLSLCLQLGFDYTWQSIMLMVLVKPLDIWVLSPDIWVFCFCILDCDT